MIKLCLKSAVGAVLCLSAIPADAAVITSLPGGTAHAIPPVNNIIGGGSEAVRSFEGGTFRTTPNALWGWTPAYDFHEAGSPAAISYHTGPGRFVFDFDQDVAAALITLDWGTQHSLWSPLTFSAFGSDGTLLEMITLVQGGVDLYERGAIGFSFADASIDRIEISGHYFSARDISTSLVGGAVPEPATWIMMIAGFGAVGASLRSRRRATTPALAMA